MIDVAPWKKYVGTLCTDAWDFDPAETSHLVADIEELIATDRVNDRSVVDVLIRAGVSETSALMIAPSVRVAIVAC